MSKKVNLYDLEFEELTQFVLDMDQPQYRARQIWEWLYQHFVTDFSKMTNLPKTFREEIVDTAEIRQSQTVSHQREGKVFGDPNGCVFDQRYDQSVDRSHNPSCVR